MVICNRFVLQQWDRKTHTKKAKSKNKQTRYLSPNVLMELDQAMRKIKRSETDKCQRPEAFPNFVNCLMMINQSQGHFAG